MYIYIYIVVGGIKKKNKQTKRVLTCFTIARVTRTAITRTRGRWIAGTWTRRHRICWLDSFNFARCGFICEWIR